MRLVRNDSHVHHWRERRLRCYVTTADGEQYIQHSTMKVCRCGATESPVNTKRTPIPP